MYRFKECREAKGFSQKFVALSLGVKPPSISDWEKGKTKPTIENLIALSDLLQVSCDELLGKTNTVQRMDQSTLTYNEEYNRVSSLIDQYDCFDTPVIGMPKCLDVLWVEDRPIAEALGIPESCVHPLV